MHPAQMAAPARTMLTNVVGRTHSCQSCGLLLGLVAFSVEPTCCCPITVSSGGAGGAGLAMSCLLSAGFFCWYALDGDTARNSTAMKLRRRIIADDEKESRIHRRPESKGKLCAAGSQPCF